jgi:DNA-binding transcriptional LysR family regulator
MEYIVAIHATKSLMDKLSALRTFVTVAEEQGFSAAAVELGLSKSQASRLISALETELGVQLLRRSTRRVSLTEQGYAYLERARSILDDVEEADRAVSQLQTEPRGILKVNGPMSFGVSHLAPAVIAFMTKYPGLSVALVLNDRYVDPYEEGYDVTIRIGELQDSSLAARKLAQVEMGVYVSPSYCSAHGRPRSPEDLSKIPALHYGNPGPSPKWLIRGPSGEYPIPIRERLCSNNGDVLREAALAGLGVTLLPAFFVRKDLERGDLVQVLDGFEPKPLSLYAIYPPTRFVSAKVRLFIDFLVDRFRRSRP